MRKTIKCSLLMLAMLSACSGDQLSFYQSSYDNQKNICNDNNFVKRSYKVDYSLQIVIQSVYYKDKLIGTDSLDSCKVIDAKNFSCGGTINEFGRNEKISVSDGVFILDSGVWSNGEKKSLSSEKCWYHKGYFGIGFIPLSSNP
jgi:hypothetical protein